MKFSVAAVLLSIGLAEAFVPQSVRPRALVPLRSSASTEDKVSKKSERLRFMKNEQFHRRGFKEVRENAETAMDEEYKSDLVNEMRVSDYIIERDGVKVHLAKVSLLHVGSFCLFSTFTQKDIPGFWFLLGSGTQHCLGIRSCGTFP